ncbi:MAG: hypothetical protein EXS37_13025 [Opitutus sp.]|nr:hypothetical protein [Opitutus sp.]
MVERDGRIYRLWNYRDRGIAGAISDILGSARLGYCVIGSDVAGYNGRSNPDDMGPATSALLSQWQPKSAAPSDVAPEFGTAAGKDEIAPNIYIRWAEFSAFCGLFINGGHGERRLWKRTPPELEIVRKFSWLHTELVPYMYSHVVMCHRGGPTLMRPTDHGKFQYLFGDDFLVAPIYEDKPTRTVALPPGGWRYLFDDREILAGARPVTRDFPLDEFPVFVRDGAIIPLKVTRPYTGFGDRDSAEFTTWLIYPRGRNSFTLHHPETHPKPGQTTVIVDAGDQLRINFSGEKQAHLLRILAKVKPASVTLDGKAVREGDGWRFEANDHRLIITTRDYVHGAYVISGWLN